MNINVKVFPIADICDSTQEFYETLTEGHLSELMELLRHRYNTNLTEKAIMILHNGKSLDLAEDPKLENNDQLWIMPVLSSG